MRNILVIGGTGQIGSELIMKLRGLYPTGNVVCGYIPVAPPKGALLESGPAEVVDITNAQQIAAAVDKYKVDTIYNLAAFMNGDIQDCIDQLMVAENAERLKESEL